MKTKIVMWCLAVLLLAASGTAWSANLEVRKPGGGGIAPLGDIYPTIQAAIDDADPCDVIIVHAGTYVEQLEITIPLTIIGDGEGATVIQSPDDLPLYFTTSADNYPIVYIHDASGVNLSDMTIDGLSKGNANYRFYGIAFHNAGGTLQDITVVNIKDTPFSGAQHGVGIYAYNTNGTDRTVNVKSCTVYDFQKTAIALNGANTTALVEGCVTTGIGDTDVTAQNGIQLGWGAGGVVKDNTVSNIRYTGPSWSATGILGIGSGGMEAITIEGNNVSNTQGGVQVYYFNGPVVLLDNTLEDNDFNYLYAFDDGAVTNNSFDTNDPCAVALYLADVTNITLTGNSFSNNYAGVVIDGATDEISFSNCEFLDNSSHGIIIQPYGTDNPDNISINQCNIVGNGSYGIENTTDNIVDATQNWWGDATGPYHPADNPSGLGDTVSDKVDFGPWYMDSSLGQSTTVHNVTKDLWYDAIQEAIDQADPCNVIEAGPGTYNEAILIDMPLTLRGATAGVNKNGYSVPANYAWDDSVESIINHPNPSGGYTAIVDIYDTSHVTFEGFVVQEQNAEANKNTSLVRVYAHTHEISNIVVRNNVIGPNTNVASQDGAQGRMGLYIVNHPYDDKGVVNSTFSGNKIFDCKGNGDNIFLWTAYFAYGAPGPASMSGTVIEDNEIYGSHRAGIETAGGFSDLTIRNNKIYDNSRLPSDDPCFLKYGNGILLIRGSGDKIGGPTTAYGPVNLTIQGNEIYNNEKNGIYSGPINSNCTITDNDIHDNGWDAIRLDMEGTYWNPQYEPEPGEWSCYDGLENIVAVDNKLYSNTGFGARVIGTPTNGFILDAESNWWGDGSGPYHAVTNVTGTGDEVSDTVDYAPWYCDEAMTTLCGVGYQRSPDVCQDSNGNYWLAYTEAINTGEASRYASLNDWHNAADYDTYDVYVKKASSLEDLLDATPVKVSNGTPEQGNLQRELGIVELGGILYIFASTGNTGGSHIYYYKSSDTDGVNWDGPIEATDLGTTGLHVHATKTNLGGGELAYISAAGGGIRTWSFDGTSFGSAYLETGWGSGGPHLGQTVAFDNVLHIAGMHSSGTAIAVATSADGIDRDPCSLRDVATGSSNYECDITIDKMGDQYMVVAAPWGAGDTQWLELYTSDSLDGPWTKQQLTDPCTGYWNYWPEIVVDGDQAYIFYASEDGGVGHIGMVAEPPIEDCPLGDLDDDCDVDINDFAIMSENWLIGVN